MVDQDDSGPRIVVALDRSEHSREALRRGSIEAGDHDGRLEVLRAWTYLDQPGPRFDPNYGEAKVRDEVARIVDEVLGADRPANTKLLIVNDLPGRAISRRQTARSSPCWGHVGWAASPASASAR